MFKEETSRTFCLTNAFVTIHGFSAGTATSSRCCAERNS